jgi:hypothetical protein
MTLVLGPNVFTFGPFMRIVLDGLQVMGRSILPKMGTQSYILSVHRDSPLDFLISQS